MEFHLTFEQALCFPNIIEETSEKHNEYSDLISERICKQYNGTDLRLKVSSMFQKFNKVKFSFNSLPENYISITSSMDITGVRSGSRINSSKTENPVDIKYDNMRWAERFYDSVLFIARDLTYQESYYLTHSLIAGKSQEDTADILNVCISKMKHIQKSCLIKLWNGLETLYMEDDE